MEKKLLLMAFALIALVSCVIDVEDKPDFSIKEKSYNVVYFLELPNCSYSAAAKKYITETYPNLAIVYMDINKKENKDYFKAARNDYNLGAGEIPTPIICLGGYCITGWDYNKRATFDEYVKSYLK